MVDPLGMKDTSLPEASPPEGIVEMVCTTFIDDPAQMEAYANFAARVDVYLSARGLRSWAHLDVERFLAAQARSRPEAATLCCMLATVLPWMVRAGDVFAREALRQCEVMLDLCGHDLDARCSVIRAMDEVGGTDPGLPTWRPH